MATRSEVCVRVRIPRAAEDDYTNEMYRRTNAWGATVPASTGGLSCRKRK